MLFVILIVLALISAVANQIWTAHHVTKHWYLGISGMFICWLGRA